MKRNRYVERSTTKHESLLPEIGAVIGVLQLPELQAWLREMMSFSRIVCANWEPHMELAAENEAKAWARKEGWI